MTRAAATILLGLTASVASAQPYAISWSTVDNGGTLSAAGGTYALAGTIGQPDAGGPFTGAPFVLHGGFWAIAAGSGGGPQADLAITKTNGQTVSVPGVPIAYTIVVSNAGPAGVAAAMVTDGPPAAITGVAWTCTASPGSSCPASGSGPISAAVSLPSGGSATFVLQGDLSPAATGTLANTASVAPPSGVTDPVSLNNAATDTDTLDPRADLGVAVADAPDPVAPGAPLVYTLEIANLGPSRSTGMTLTSVPDAGLVDFVASTPGAPACTYASGLTCGLGPLDPGAGATVTLEVRAKPGASGSIVNQATVAGATNDPIPANNTAQSATSVQAPAPFTELLHGTRLERSLPAAVGVAGDQFRMRQEPYASYEIVVDAASGDLGVGAGPALELIDTQGQVLQSSVALGTGPARSLRLRNATSQAAEAGRVRVRTLDPSQLGGPEDTYRLRAWETTLTVPRFNNTGTQATVVLLQNPTALPVQATLFFWSPAGALLATHTPAAPLPPKGLLVVSTAGVPALIGVGGSLTVVHDAPYGTLSGKAVALEPATGFSFDSPLQSRPR